MRKIIIIFLTIAFLLLSFNYLSIKMNGRYLLPMTNGCLIFLGFSLPYNILNKNDKARKDRISEEK